MKQLCGFILVWPLLVYGSWFHQLVTNTYGWKINRINTQNNGVLMELRILWWREAKHSIVWATSLGWDKMGLWGKGWHLSQAQYWINVFVALWGIYTFQYIWFQICEILAAMLGYDQCFFSGPEPNETLKRTRFEKVLRPNGKHKNNVSHSAIKPSMNIPLVQWCQIFCRWSSCLIYLYVKSAWILSLLWV